MSRNYKFDNPVEDGFVYHPEDLYSSARDYSGETGLMEGINKVIPHDKIVRQQRGALLCIHMIVF